MTPDRVSGVALAVLGAFVLEECWRLRLPLGTLRLGGMGGAQDWPAWMMALRDDDVRPPRVPAPEDVLVMVAGGAGKHSSVIPNCCFSRAVSRVMKLKGAEAAPSNFMSPARERPLHTRRLALRWGT